MNVCSNAFCISFPVVISGGGDSGKVTPVLSDPEDIFTPIGMFTLYRAQCATVSSHGE